MTLPIIAKLRALEGGEDDFGDRSCVTMYHRNPDGLEAAEIIEGLYRALELAREHCLLNDMATPRVMEKIDEALIKARGKAGEGM